jgi:NAD(P)-dependent dehydrogenase (short-subunit alcohol dehydrogenase family)
MAKAERTLNGKVAVVTGGARGIGKATAEALAREGARVGIGDLDGSLAAAAASEVGQAARGYELDVTDIDSYERFLDAVAAELGPLDVLVNNAGIMPLGAFADETVTATARQVGVNIFGVTNGCRLAIPRLSGRREAHIVNIGSAAGKAGYPGVATYCGTKHFVIGFSEGLRTELKPLGIEVTCVMPSVVNTELSLGMAEMPGFKKIEPTDVAAAVIEALKRPRLEVFVPRSVGAISRMMVLLPRAAKDAAVKLTGTDEAALHPDWAARAAYEQRAVGTEHGAEQTSPQALGDRSAV